ncbi:hypothetical protein MCEMIH15_01061 [Caulobacteraceae bacterium]
MDEKPNNRSATQVLDYRGMVFFRVPAWWLVAMEDDDQIVIFEDREASGTLRPWAEEYVFDDNTQRDATAHGLHEGQLTESLSEHVVLSYEVQDGEEEGEALSHHRWTVTIRVGEKLLRVVTFTFTVEPKNEGTDDTNWELQVVGLAVRSALYPDSKSEAFS